MKKSIWLVLAIMACTSGTGCDKLRNCGCGSAGYYMENVDAFVVRYGNRTLQTEKPVRGATLFRACEDLPDSLRKDNLRITISGYFKENCEDEDQLRTGFPLTITQATIR